jgi:hypothetical protein
VPDRIVRAGILTSDPVNQLSWAAEVFYRRLMNAADDFGRYDGRPSILRATLYPLKLDRVSERDIETWLCQCEETGLVTVYTVEDKPYIEILKFDQRLRAKTSKWPPPQSIAVKRPRVSADGGHVLSNATEVNSESNSESDIASDDAKRPPKGRAKDPIWDALLAVCGLKDSTPTTSERGAWNKAVQSLRAVNATPSEIQARAIAYRKKWPSVSLTPTALARRWSECVAKANGTTPESARPPDDYYQPSGDINPIYRKEKS